MKPEELGMSTILMLVIIVFCFGGWVGYFTYSFLNPATENIKIKYVSEDEIMSLERARLKIENIEYAKKKLFFGNIDEALALTMKIASSKGDRSTKVIFSLSPVFADRVDSISSDVHKEVIEIMRKKKNN